MHNSISQSILSISNESLKTANPLSSELAGSALLFLIFDLFFYWGILAFIEYGYLRACLNRFKSSPGHNKRNSEDMYIDPDVRAEENRVHATSQENSNLTVRLCDFKKTYDD